MRSLKICPEEEMSCISVYVAILDWILQSASQGSKLELAFQIQDVKSNNQPWKYHITIAIDASDIF